MIYRYDDCGHVPMEELPEKSAKDCLNFIDSILKLDRHTQPREHDRDAYDGAKSDSSYTNRATRSVSQGLKEVKESPLHGLDPPAAASAGDTMHSAVQIKSVDERIGGHVDGNYDGRPMQIAIHSNL